MPNKLADSLEQMRQGKALTCGVWPYLLGVRLTCRGYKALKAGGLSIKSASKVSEGLEVRDGDKVALVGMTRALRKKLAASGGKGQDAGS